VGSGQCHRESFAIDGLLIADPDRFVSQFSVLGSQKNSGATQRELRTLLKDLESAHESYL
jgi:hypothetical protein